MYCYQAHFADEALGGEATHPDVQDQGSNLAALSE